MEKQRKGLIVKIDNTNGYKVVVASIKDGKLDVQAITISNDISYTGFKYFDMAEVVVVQGDSVGKMNNPAVFGLNDSESYLIATTYFADILSKRNGHLNDASLHRLKGDNELSKSCEQRAAELHRDCIVLLDAIGEEYARLHSETKGKYRKMGHCRRVQTQVN